MTGGMDEMKALTFGRNILLLTIRGKVTVAGAHERRRKRKKMQEERPAGSGNRAP